METAERLARTIAGAELHVAAGLEDIRKWPEVIRAFVRAVKQPA